MTPRRTATRLAAAATAGAVVLLTATPALAADPVAQASATAVELSIGGSPADSGTYSVTHDGEREQASGSRNPAVSVLTGQSFIQAGTLAQDARTRVVDRNGESAACAGLAGDGAVLAEVGDGGCLTPGDNLELTAANLDLSDLRLVEAGLLQGLDQQLQDALQPVLGPVLAGLQTALQQVLTGADAAVVLDVGAIQSFCVARPGDITGDARLAGAGARVRLLGQEVTLLDLPADPEPNTKLVTDLGKVADVLLVALETQFANALDGAFGPLGDATAEARVLTNALEQIGEQLAPLEENVLDVTLNKQERGPRQITVTALDLQLLPAAAEGFGAVPLTLAIGRSTCGPNGRVTVDAPDPTPAPEPQPQPDPEVPTSVPAGSGDGGLGTGALVALLLTAVASGTVAARRRLRA